MKEVMFSLNDVHTAFIRVLRKALACPVKEDYVLVCAVIDSLQSAYNLNNNGDILDYYKTLYQPNTWQYRTVDKASHVLTNHAAWYAYIAKEVITND